MSFRCRGSRGRSGRSSGVNPICLRTRTPRKPWRRTGAPKTLSTTTPATSSRSHSQVFLWEAPHFPVFLDSLFLSSAPHRRSGRVRRPREAEAFLRFSDFCLFSGTVASANTVMFISFLSFICMISAELMWCFRLKHVMRYLSV